MIQQVDNVNRSQKPGDDEVLELVHAVMHLFRTQQLQALRGDSGERPHPAGRAADGDGAGPLRSAGSGSTHEFPQELTHMETKVLGFFGRRPGATQSDLVQHSGRDKAQLARLIKGLRERGLLAAEADGQDRRQVHLQLTGEGQAVQRKLRLQARQLQAQAVTGLSPDERRQLVTLLRRVKGNLEHGG
jgi:DNA-binding MarR family transcriptional regulator